MKEVFLQLNVALGIGCLIFQFLPLEKVNFRSRTTIARILVFSSLLSVCVFAVLPDSLFPDMFPEILIEIGRDVDSAKNDTKATTVSAINQNSAITNSSKDQSKFLEFWHWAVLLGFLFMALKMLLNWLQLGKVLRGSLALHKIGSVVVSISDSVAIPFSTMFLGKAFVVLPSSLVPHQKEFGIALRHEIEHHRNRDTRWAVLLELIVCAFYMNPFAYLWRRTISQLQELACDESLISQMGISKHDYGSCLLKVAEMALGSRNMYVGTTCMISNTKSEDHSFLIRRIKMFNHHEQASLRKWQGLALGTILSAFIFGGVYFAHAAVRSNSAPNPGTPIFNQNIQSATEGILAKGLKKFKASAGFAIVADPETGVILASANINNGFDNSLSENWALSYPVQPASALKPLLIGSAIRANVTQINEMHECENGKYEFGGEIFHDYKAFDRLSSADTIAQSSNICTIKVGQKLGATGIENGLKEFGFGKGGVAKDFPSARSGHVPSTNGINKDKFIGNIALGSSKQAKFYVTPLELVQAYGAIANGGSLMKPIDTAGNQSPEIIRAVLSRQTSLELQDALREVVLSGTAKSIKHSAGKIAGKTSTADIGNNHRATGFIGYAPADHPKLVAYVVLFDPKGKHRVGSNTAAPVFRDVIESALSKYNP
ncbi:MAG: hypothetical protein H6625_11785 [Bdellovibrionaceae bacterium]|nr:hypothetical protein [Pseudobdellovibrionaceae bacterium]